MHHPIQSPHWIVTVSGVDQRGTYFHSGHATRHAANIARVDVQKQEDRAFLDHKHVHPDISPPRVEVACWPHERILEPGQEVDIRCGFAHPHSPLDYVPDHSCVLHQLDHDRTYQAVAVLAYDHFDAFALLTVDDWTSWQGVMLLTDDARERIERGDVIETSSGLTFAYEDNQFRVVHPSVLTESGIPKATHRQEPFLSLQREEHEALRIKIRL